MEAGTSQVLKEDWVEFTRFYCKNGFIDRWLGDCINNPNNAKKHPMCLNVSAQYFRFDGGEWINSKEFRKSNFFEIIDMRTEFTAEEIYNHLKTQNLNP